MFCFVALMLLLRAEKQIELKNIWFISSVAVLQMITENSISGLLYCWKQQLHRKKGLKSAGSGVSAHSPYSMFSSFFLSILNLSSTHSGSKLCSCAVSGPGPPSSSSSSSFSSLSLCRASLGSGIATEPGPTLLSASGCCGATAATAWALSSGVAVVAIAGLSPRQCVCMGVRKCAWVWPRQLANTEKRGRVWDPPLSPPEPFFKFPTPFTSLSLSLCFGLTSQMWVEPLLQHRQSFLYLGSVLVRQIDSGTHSDLNGSPVITWHSRSASSDLYI